jgi:hypothetical protein
MTLDWRRAQMDGNNDRNRVKETAAPFTPAETDDDWVHELIAMTRPGVEINLPHRGLGDRVIPFAFDDFS